MYNCDQCRDRKIIVAPWEKLDPIEGCEPAERIPCPICNPVGYANAILQYEELSKPKTVAGRTLAEWREFARRDDCLDHMVPGDLRELLSKIDKF